MSKLKKPLGFGSILLLFLANGLLLATGPRTASAGGPECSQLGGDCWCFGNVCAEDEMAFDQCVPGFTEYEGEHLLDQIFVNGEPTGEVCGDAT